MSKFKKKERFRNELEESWLYVFRVPLFVISDICEVYLSVCCGSECHIAQPLSVLCSVMFQFCFRLS